MPTFETTEPVSVTVNVSVGNIRLVAGKRTDAVVEVLPTDPTRDLDVRMAEETRVEFTNGRLLIKAPKQRTWLRRSQSIDVRIALPTGSHLTGTGAIVDLHAEGPLGVCRFKTATGDLRIDWADTVNLTTSYGDVTVGHCQGFAEVTTGSGEVRVGGVDGSAVVKNSNGGIHVDDITGDLRVRSANGGIRVNVAHSGVDAKTSNGPIRIGEVARGSVVLETGAGGLKVGIREGSAAWLDVSSSAGRVRNTLDASDGPGESADTVEVHGRTGLGDIVIHRS